MKTIKANRIAVVVAALGLTAAPFLSGVAEAKEHNKGHHDNGKHLGWDKGKGNKHSDEDRNWNRDDERRTWRPTTSKRKTVREHWTKGRPTNSRPTYRPTSTSWRLNNTRPFGTKASAERAAALRRQLGYRTSVVWNPSRRVYEVREYHNPTSRRTDPRRTNPVSSSNLIGTHYYSTQASAAAGVRFAQAKGYRATSTYNRSQNRWIVRVYSR